MGEDRPVSFRIVRPGAGPDDLPLYRWIVALPFVPPDDWIPSGVTELLIPGFPDPIRPPWVVEKDDGEGWREVQRCP